MPHESDTVRILQKAMCATCLVTCYLYTAVYIMNDWMNWISQCLKSNWTGDVMRTIRAIVQICRSVSFFDKYSKPINISRWLSDMLTLLPVFTQIFRLFFVSCFDTNKTDGIHPLHNMTSRFVKNVHRIFSNFWNIHITPTILLWLSDNIWHHMN